MEKIDTDKIKARFSDDMGNYDEEIHNLCDAYDEAMKEIDMLNKTISTILNPHINHGVIKDITLEESND